MTKRVRPDSSHHALRQHPRPAGVRATPLSAGTGGPGPTVIGAWREISTLPPLATDELDAFAAELDGLLRAHRPGREQRPGRSRDVWHCTIRDHPDAPSLTDAQWAATARRVLAATGIVPADRPGAGCRWIALRLDKHEVRIIAPLMRPDGTAPQLHRDHSLAHAACQLAELEHSVGRHRAQAAHVRHAASATALAAPAVRSWTSPGAAASPRR
ncbi:MULTISPECIES: hypothetical protein [unclassified Kitasatospora]|uniref:hypothetical protein n=1 Tax=unclassified Kitasatospora TaxID=2633591 RepID=UPI0012F8A822|nr:MULTISPECIES: hypothetical protein [unclassified Kitasatospora]